MLCFDGMHLGNILMSQLLVNLFQECLIGLELGVINGEATYMLHKILVGWFLEPEDFDPAESGHRSRFNIVQLLHQLFLDIFRKQKGFLYALMRTHSLNFKSDDNLIYQLLYCSELVKLK